MAPHLKEGVANEHGLSGFENWLSVRHLAKRLDMASRYLSDRRCQSHSVGYKYVYRGEIQGTMTMITEIEIACCGPTK